MNEDRQALAHVLNRIAFGPSADDWDRAAGIGVEAFIDEQLHAGRDEDKRVERSLAGFETLKMGFAELIRKYPSPQMAARLLREDEEPDPEMIRELAARSTVPLQELSAARLVRALHSRRQLQEVLTDFWFNHFNVFARKGQIRFTLTSYERDVIRPHVLGNFRGMLGAVARSPAMLLYLDNWRSGAEPDREVAAAATVSPRGEAVDDVIRRMNRRFRLGMGRQPRAETQMARQRRGRRRPEGLNENYARELLELHTLGVDGGYTQEDVRGVARAFTGWTVSIRPPEDRGFTFRPSWHDAEEKVVLGWTLPAGRGIEDAEDVLDMLVEHPSTARFVATKLARRFVTDDPPTGLVERAAATFRESSGDLRETTATVLRSEEFLGPEYRCRKVKNPLEFLASAARGLGLPVDAAARLPRALARLGAPLYGAAPPTGYPDCAEEHSSANALLARMEVGAALAQAVFGDAVEGTREPLRRLAGARRGGTLRGPRGSVAERTDALIEQLLPGRDPERLRDKLTAWSGGQDAEPSNGQLAALILGSPDFQRR